MCYYYSINSILHVYVNVTSHTKVQLSCVCVGGGGGVVGVEHNTWLISGYKCNFPVLYLRCL